MAADENLLQLPTRISFSKDVIESPNLCDRFKKDDLAKLGEWVYDGYKRDLSSRSKWERRTRAAMDLAMQIQKQKNFPWPGCSAVAFPLVTIAALQFSANSYEDIIQGTDVVQYRVIGDDPGGLVAARADRVGRHMSWQCLEQDQAWEEQHDRLLINLAVVGTAFIKTYWDADLTYPVGDLVTAQDLVVNYWAKSLETAARKTQRTALYRNEIYSRIKRGVFRDVRGEGWYSSIPVMPSDQDAERDNRLGVNPVQPDAQSPFPCLEQHTFFDLDHDGYAEPYIVTVEESSHCVLRITARVEDESAVERNVSKEIVSIAPKEYYTKYPFIANPDGGFYDLGFGVLMGPLNESVSTIVNQMIDNGTLHNASGGFIGRGVNLRGGPYTMAPFEFRRVDATGDDIRKNLYVFEPQETPQVLFSLLGLLIEYSNRIAGTTDVMVGENPGQNTPASTFQGLQERGMKIYGWIFKRIWRAMKGEFKQRFELNGHWMPSRVNFGQQNALVYAEDYIGNPDQIAPVADPNLPSSVMRQQQALLVGQRALAVPGYDHDEVERNVLRAFKVQNPARLYLGVERAKPLPNPKVQMEQFKLQAKQLELRAKQLEWANKLMEDRRLNDAKILELHAQAYSLIKGTQGAEAAQQLERFELVLNTLGEYSKHLTQRISELSNASQSRGSDGAGMGGMEGDADDTGLAGDASAAEGAAQGGPGGGGGGNGAAPGGAE